MATTTTIAIAAASTRTEPVLTLAECDEIMAEEFFPSHTQLPNHGNCCLQGLSGGEGLRKEGGDGRRVRGTGENADPPEKRPVTVLSSAESPHGSLRARRSVWIPHQPRKIHHFSLRKLTHPVTPQATEPISHPRSARLQTPRFPRIF